MATTDELLNKINEIVSVLQSAEQTVVAGVEMIRSAPLVANEAKTAAETALANSTTAVNTANAAMPKTGGNFSGNVGIGNNMPQLIFDGASLERGVMPTQTRTYGNTFRDKDNSVLGQAFHQAVSEFAQMGHWMHPLHDKTQNTIYQIGLRVYATGEAIGMSPPPRENVNENDIDTKRASVNRHPLKQTEQKVIHIGGANASDTANLNAGRGLSAAMPFATISAAFNWGLASYPASIYPLIFHIHEDWALNEIGIHAPAGYGMVLQADSNVTLTLRGPIKLLSGTLTLQGIKIAGNGLENFFKVGSGYNGLATLVFGNNVSLSGSVTDAVVKGFWGGEIKIPGVITGSVAGKRYDIYHGARILVNNKGEGAIPGTIAGTKDSTSIYI